MTVKTAQGEPIQETPDKTTTTQEPEKKPEPTIQEIIEQAKKDIFAEVDSKYKTEIAGLNRKVSEVTKERDDARKAKMTEEERVKAELEEARTQAESARKEAENYKRSTLINKLLSENGLPIEFETRIQGKTDDEIKADVTALKKYIDAQVKAISENEVNKRLGGEPLKRGDKPAGDKLTLEEIEAIPDPAKRVKALRDLGYA